ncbi:MAG: peptide chain release factor 1 [Actinomycetales bacterium]|nr:peptide chain release factor 1 [Candidatus Phosphoribacter baldrii]
MSDPTTEAAQALLASAAPLVAEHAELERAMTDPALHADQTALRRTTKRYAALGPVVAAYRTLAAARADLAAAHELASEDPAFAEELPAIEATSAAAQERLHTLLLPRDPDDDRDAILEVKAGEGGEESALFAGDLLRMYLRYAERRGWKAEVLDETESDLGGIKEARVAVRAKGTPQPGEAPWARLKFEGGVHRVQRVPVTESQGRIHTSAAGILVMPDIDEGDDEIEISPADLRIDVYRSSGPGGQSVNTTDSAVRITHLPTGLVVSCQNEKSQLQNKESALRVLKARLRQAAREAAEAQASAARRSQVRTVDRSERIRTYNFPENRIADHRTGFKAYNLDIVLEGDLDPVIQSCLDADEAERMAGAGGVGGSGELTRS